MSYEKCYNTYYNCMQHIKKLQNSMITTLIGYFPTFFYLCDITAQPATSIFLYSIIYIGFT